MSSTPEPPAPGDDPDAVPERAPGEDEARGDAASTGTPPDEAAGTEPPGWSPAYGPPPAYPGEGAPASGSMAATPQAPGVPKRPPVWGGLLAGIGLQIAGLIVMVMLLTVSFSSPGNWGVVILLLPFIALLVGPALLLISWRWRRFATGVLIISAATWLIIIGPCLGLSMGA